MTGSCTRNWKPGKQKKNMKLVLSKGNSYWRYLCIEHCSQHRNDQKLCSEKEPHPWAKMKVNGNCYRTFTSPTTVQMLDIAKPRCIFLPLNQHGCPNIQPKFWKENCLKTLDLPGKCIFSQSRYCKFKKIFHRTVVVIRQFHPSTQ